MNERNEFQVGEVVDVTIRGARIERVQDEGHDGDVTRVAGIVAHDGDGAPFFTAVPLDWTTVLVERRAPAEWPPRPGDLWRDRDGRLWFTVESDSDYGVALTCNGRNRRPAAEIHGLYSPLTLVHREGGDA